MAPGKRRSINRNHQVADNLRLATINSAELKAMERRAE